MKIKFHKDFRPQGQADSIPSYVAGVAYAFEGTVAEGYARKYINRGLAEEMTAKPAAPVEVEIDAPADDEPAESEPTDEPEQPRHFRGRKRR